MAEQDPWLGPLAQRMRGLKPPRFPTVFEALVNGIACQQLSLVVGIHLLNRLTAAHGRPVSADTHGPRAFPDPDQLASLQPESLMRHGFSLTKARTIVDAARAIVAGELELEALERLDDHAAMEHLTRLRGVGRWTAEYVLLRGLGRLEIFPATTSARTTASDVTWTSTPRWTTRACNASSPAGSPTRGWSTSTCSSTHSPARAS
jgi:DNA-3-methyladenine glycosylase II